jgi:hypothetical protein
MAIYIVFIIANLITVFYLYGFMKKYVYYAYFPERDQSLSLVSARQTDINMDKFESIVENFQSKTSLTVFNRNKNLFD